MNVYEPCIAVKGQALSQILQPLSWVCLWLCVLALTCAQIWGVSVCVWICDLQVSLCVYYKGLNQYSEDSKSIHTVCLFYRTQRSHKVHNFEGGNYILLL